MRKKYFLIAILLVCLTFSCEKTKSSAVNGESEINLFVKTETLDIREADLHEYLSGLCDAFSFEFTGLYPEVASYPSIEEDELKLEAYLMEKGFTITSKSFGNWEDGPRFIALEMRSGDCQCTIFKKYHYSTQSEDSLVVTEKIVCNAGNNTIE